MNVFSYVSAVLLSVILFWAIYHASIVFAGLRSRRKCTRGLVTCKVEYFPKFSLIVPARDEAVVIGRCLNSLLSLDYPKEKLELLVVVGASKDSTQAICSEFANKHPDLIKIIPEAASKGKPKALNLALSHVTGEIVGVFDADSRPEKDVLKKVASYFGDSSVTALQGTAFSLNESQNMLTRVAAAEDKAWFHGLLRGREQLGLFVAFTGSCQFIRSKVLRELGGWESSAIAEDVELSLKLVKNGGSVKFASDVSSGLETPFSWKSLITQRSRWYRGYMEASLKYGSLLEKVNRRVIDAELSLVGPFIMLVCLASYVNWGVSFLFSSEGGLFPISSTLVVILNSVTLISLGVSMAYFVRPIRVKNILWVPFVYGYWFVQMLIAFWVFIHFALRRPVVWGKTIKGGFVSGRSVFGRLSRLKVCLVSSYPPNRARLSEYAKSLVNELENRPAIGELYLLADKNISSGRVQGVERKTRILRVWKPDSPLSILKIMLYILKIRPNVVHFNVHFQSYGRSRISNFFGLSLIFVSRLLGLKVLAEVHNLGEKVDLEKVQLKPSVVNKMGIFLATKLILSAPSVVVTVRSYASYLQTRYSHRGVKYIPHGTLCSGCRLIEPSEKVILLFGHMGPYKGLPIMLKAFEKLRAEKSDVRLIVAGTSHPNYPQFLDEYVKAGIPRVDFLGYVPEDEVEAVFCRADVVVIPYVATTGTSGVFHLSCGYGRPIVASDLPEIHEMVSEGASALLVPPGDVEALKAGIVRVLGDPELAVKMSERNLAFASRESWGIVAQAYESAYLELINR